MYLVDTNIWLERLLGQAKSDEVGQFLERRNGRIISHHRQLNHSITRVLSLC